MPPGLRGQRVVVGLYCIIVAFTGLAGYATASVVDEIDPPRLLFLVELPPTPLGLAVFGAVTIGLVLGVLLVAVTVVSAYADDAAPGSAAQAGGIPSDGPSTDESVTDDAPVDDRQDL
ncbi:MAG: DUF7520 family protein [Halohasta sp.]